MSLAHWDAARWVTVGPDKKSPWDLLPGYGCLQRTYEKCPSLPPSNGGGTTHAFGVKVGPDSFGNDDGVPLKKTVPCEKGKKRGDFSWNCSNWSPYRARNSHFCGFRPSKKPL